MKRALLVCCLLIGGNIPAYAATVWTGPDVVFSKNGSDPTSVQDILSASVSLTRGAAAFLFNPLAGEISSSATSPAGTAWAFAGLLGNPTGNDFTASNYTALNFDTFLNALGGPGPAQGGSVGIGNAILNQPGVLHLIAEDIYLDIQFTEWTDAFNGSIVSYARSSAVVPIPAALPLFSLALGLLALRRKTLC